jgi:hypothetical protein
MNHISLFSELLTFGMDLQQHVEPVPDVELNEDWKEFETTLDEFKSEYVADRYNMYQKEIDYTVADCTQEDSRCHIETGCSDVHR